MLVKALVLDGDGRMDQALGDLIQSSPLAVGAGVDLFVFLDLAVFIHIINEGGLIQTEVLLVEGHIGDHILLQIFGGGARHDNAADHGDQAHGDHAANGDLRHGQRRTHGAAKQLQQRRNLPFLPFGFLSVE